jgi:XTP/dITP diphosphohydrolase
LVVSDPQKLLLATNNPGKVGELQALMADLAGIRLITLDELGIDLEPPETASTYMDNAASKAVAFAAASGLPSLADDSGLEVAALGGAPGVHSARYAPQPGATDADRRAYLLSQLSGKPQPWPARFVSTICLALPNGQTFFANGECRGHIVSKERGSGGFGYDAIFEVEGLGRTMAELTMAEKNQLSHRARAVAQAKQILRRELLGGASL